MRRMKMILDLETYAPSKASMTEGWSIRPAVVGDHEALAELMLEAYRGTPDDEGGDLDEARQEVAKLFAGDYGDYMTSASFVAERGGTLHSACLVTHFEDEPLIAFLMTRPESKRRGLGLALTRATASSLAQSGAQKVGLFVTVANEAAVGLYDKLGFVSMRARSASGGGQ